MLSIKGLSHWVSDGTNKRQVLANLSLQIKQRESIAIMGDSGCGKSTLLNLIAGLAPIQQGQISVGDLHLQHASENQISGLRKEQMGIIFQHFNLLSSLTVIENIEFSARLANRFTPSLTAELLSELGIKQLQQSYPATLSGGEMQRVAIARAIAARPSLLLADEPTGDLDDVNSQLVVQTLLKLVESHNIALIMVTHSKKVAQQLNKVFLLREGSLQPFTQLEGC